jgi:hypothetical protein
LDNTDPYLLTDLSENAAKQRRFRCKRVACGDEISSLKGYLPPPPKKNYDDMSVALGDKRPSYSTVKSCPAGFRTGHINTEDEQRSGRPTQVTIPENVNAIHSMILDDRRIAV